MTNKTMICDWCCSSFEVNGELLEISGYYYCGDECYDNAIEAAETIEEE